MQLHVIDTGFFKLDGGAMFGVVPKSIWQKTNPADSNNLCSWALRCLLIEDGNRLILIDTGVGNKQDNRFFSHYYLHGEASLDSSLKLKGFRKEDITDVVLTHLHFDHCGGSIEWNNARTGFIPTFKNATYWSTREHWDWATKPNAREKASFLKENILPIQESGQLKFIVQETANTDLPLGSNVSFLFMNGHTESMMLPKIKYKDLTIVYMADLLPSVGHIPLPYLMAYDVRPLVTLKEKETFMQDAAMDKTILFFEHDAVNECCTVKATEKGIRLDEVFQLKAII